MAQGDLSDTCRTKLQAILRFLLSSQSYLNDEQIALFRKQEYSQGNYFVSIFGMPSTEKDWAFRLGGHHFSFNVTYSKGTISLTPVFWGLDPPEVHIGKYARFRVLGKEEDLGIQLFKTFSAKQKKKAIFTDKVIRNVVTLPAASERIDKMQGISAS